MSTLLKAACVQNCAGPDMQSNLELAAEQIRQARNQGADLIAVPEFFSCLHLDASGLHTGVFPETKHPALSLFRSLALETGAWLLLGSLAIEDVDGKARNRSFLISPNSGIIARYDKIHMFDVDLSEEESYRESDFFQPGEQAVVAPSPWGGIGLSVCYDLRFAALYRSLAKAGAAILTVPAAFTHTTGRAHWHCLLRARAIETGCYVIAPCQSGHHGNAHTYGHSLIIDPWGQVLAEGQENHEDVIIADIDLAQVEIARNRIPALSNDRAFAEPSPANR